MNCPNPKCGMSEEQYSNQFGDWYTEHYPLFVYKMEDENGRRVLVYKPITKGHFWVRCTMCDTEFRPTKTLNNDIIREISMNYKSKERTINDENET